MEKNICRVCFDLVENEFEIIDGITRKMFDDLLLKMDLDASSNPILCQECSKMIKALYHFKSTCMNAEKRVQNLSAAYQSTKFDIKDVYKDAKCVEVVPDENDICRFCLNQIGRISCVSIDILMKDIMFVKVFPVFMPKSDPHIIDDPVICRSCKEVLECYSKLTRTCLDTEEKINKYRQSGKVDIINRIKLNDVLVFLFNEISFTYPDECTQMIKQEDLFDEVEQDVNMHEEQIKYEALDIKDEAVNSGNSCTKVMYKCEICTYETKYKKGLKVHMLVHKDTSEVEMHKCELCTYKTKYKTKIKNHMLIHKDTSEVEIYKCGICTYETRYKEYLKKHMLIHKKFLEEEMHKCSICTYKTKFKSNIKHHMLLHKDTSEVDMHRCKMCTYETKYKQSLKRHLLKHKDTSEVEMHKCGTCTFESKYTGAFKKHMLRHTNGN